MLWTISKCEISGVSRWTYVLYTINKYSVYFADWINACAFLFISEALLICLHCRPLSECSCKMYIQMRKPKNEILISFCVNQWMRNICLCYSTWTILVLLNDFAIVHIAAITLRNCLIFVVRSSSIEINLIDVQMRLYLFMVCWNWRRQVIMINSVWRIQYAWEVQREFPFITQT